MRAAIYARKSTEQAVAEELKSVIRQVELARKFATAKGWTVADEHVFVDDGISVAEFARRPGLQRLMRLLNPRAPFSVLVVAEQKAIGREAIETQMTIQDAVRGRRRGVGIHARPESDPSQCDGQGNAVAARLR